MEGEDRIEYNGIERKNSLECSLSCAHHDDCKTWHFFQENRKCFRYRASWQESLDNYLLQSPHNIAGSQKCYGGKQLKRSYKIIVYNFIIYSNQFEYELL